MKLIDFGLFQNFKQMLSHDKIIVHMLFGAFHVTFRTCLPVLTSKVSCSIETSSSIQVNSVSIFICEISEFTKPFKWRDSTTHHIMRCFDTNCFCSREMRIVDCMKKCSQIFQVKGTIFGIWDGADEDTTKLWYVALLRIDFKVKLSAFFCYPLVKSRGQPNRPLWPKTVVLRLDC